MERTRRENVNSTRTNKEDRTMRNYIKNVFNELRMLVISNEERPLSDENLIKAVTLNENLKAYGYCLKPADIVRVAGSLSLENFYEVFKSLQGEVLAKPMYPDFPSQVMNMSEAQFRLHQAAHYFSTYGLEYLFGVSVDRGWLPQVTSTDKTEKDVALLAAKPFELISEDEMYIRPLRKILEKKERMTLPEKAIVSQALSHVEPELLAEISVPFKENLVDVFCIIADDTQPEAALQLLHNLCKNTNDVWRCLHVFLGRHGRHLTTSQKRLFVKLFESYPIADFQANLIVTNTKAEKIIRTLEYLSFNRFSRSAEHREAVRKLRNGELRSWQGQVDFLLSSDGEKALDFIATRPGMLVRFTARLLRLGYRQEDIAAKLVAHADALSMQTLLSLLNHFGADAVLSERDDAEAVYSVMLEALRAKMVTLETPIKGKKIFLDEGDFSLDFSCIEKSSEEGGYVRSGLAFKVPEAARRVRFFVYWNDKSRVDVDLHGAAITKDGECVHVGWNGGYNESGLVHSGDITHSDAAEYIDIDLEKTDARYVTFSIDLFSGKPNFGLIDTCFVGMTAVNRINEKVKLYDPKNCFFSHDLKSKERGLYYGHLDVENRVLTVGGNPNGRSYTSLKVRTFRYSLRKFLEDLAEAQGAEVVARDEADVVLVMGKPNAENEISIIDSNFFCD